MTPRRVRVGQVFLFNARGWDRLDRRSNTPPDGTLVRVVRPRGCPAPGAMGHCHVEWGPSGGFALVSLASLSTLP